MIEDEGSKEMRETMNRERSKDGVRRQSGETFAETSKRRRNEDDERARGDDDRRRRIEGDDKNRSQQDFFDDIGPDGVSSPRYGQDDESLEPVINTSKLNPKNMDEQRLEGALYFIIKSYSIEDVMISIKDGVWNSTDQGNRKLNHGYREARNNNSAVILFFSVTGSKQFSGTAQIKETGS